MADYFEPITEEKLKTIYDEFGVTEESLRNDVAILVDWLEKQPHLPNVKDTEWLTHFLLCCKNSLERAKQKLDAYFTAKALNQNIFTQRLELTLSVSFLKYMCFIPMPKLTKECRRVLIFRIFPEPGFSGMPSELLVKYTQLLYDMLMKGDKASQYIIIADYENMSLQMMALYFPVIKKLVDQITKINPIRVHKFYIMNVSPAVEPLVNFLTSLLSKKLANRLIIWKKKSKELVEVIDEEVLPPLYGGTEKSMEVLRYTFIDYFKSMANWILSEEQIKADLDKKPNHNGVPTDIGDYGVEGTFRKINLD